MSDQTESLAERPASKTEYMAAELEYQAHTKIPAQWTVTHDSMLAAAAELRRLEAVEKDNRRLREGIEEHMGYHMDELGLPYGSKGDQRLWALLDVPSTEEAPSGK